MTHTAGTAHLSPRTATPLLQIQDLDVTFTTSAGDVPAVRGANLAVYPGQTVAIVGESGSGKSTTAMAISQLLPRNGAITGGRIDFQGRDISRATGKEILALRGSEIGLVPQWSNTLVGRRDALVAELFLADTENLHQPARRHRVRHRRMMQHRARLPCLGGPTEFATT